MKLAFPRIQRDSIVDGEGIRAVIWTQGCPHHCENCHNPETWDIQGGYDIDIESIKKELDSLKNHNGITLSGGEPFLQPNEILELATYAKGLSLTVWCFTGFTWEQLTQMSNNNQTYMDVLKSIDVLIDGKYEESQRSLNLYYRGSRNQKIIDVQKSLEANELIQVERYISDKSLCALYKKPDNLFV